jgi:quercetin dioxygenase-like cupin family protein
MMFPWGRGTTAAVLAVLLASGIVAGGAWAASAEEKKPIVRRVINTAPLGELPFRNAEMQMLELVIQPGFETSEHIHEGVGIRYLLEGSLIVSWKGGEEQTLRAGDTFFEGAGEEYRMKAKNPGNIPTRILVVELRPRQEPK